MYICIYIYIYIGSQDSSKGVQWKQGVVICMMLYTSSLYNTAPIHCTPLPLHPPVMNTQDCGGMGSALQEVFAAVRVR